MRLKKIAVHNLTRLRARVINIPADAAVVLIAGPNGSGKSSLLEGIRFALSGEIPRGLAYKKDVRQTVTRGETAGHVGVTVENGDGTESEYKVSLTTGNYAGSSAPPMGSAALTLMPQRFMLMDATDRRRALFQRTGIDVTATGVTAQLVAGGHDTDLVAEIKASFGSGFERAARTAQELASEARAGWQAITDETFGTVKAATWTAESPESPQDAEALQLELTDALDTHMRASNELQAIEADVAVNRDRAKHEGLRDELPALAAEIEQLGQRIVAKEAAIREEESGSLPAGAWECGCPNCGTLLLATDDKKLAVSDRSPSTSDGQKGLLVQLKKELGILQQSLRDKKNRQEHALGSRQLLGQMPPQPLAEDVAEARSAAQREGQAVQLLRSQHEKAIRDGMLARTAADRTARARVKYERYMGFTALAAGIETLPAAYLDEALKRINHAMGVVSTALGDTVSLGEDMDLRYGPTPYHLASESERWRMDFALGVALANIDNGMVLMDGFDVLEPAARGPLLQLMPELGVQLVIAATLKNAPKLPAPAFHVEWLGIRPLAPE